MTEYEEFLKTKAATAISSGFDFPTEKMNPNMFDWQKDIVRWALKKGRAALFENCGCGKTIQQLEWSQRINEHTKSPVIILAPLSVVEQTRREGDKFGYGVNIVRNDNEVINGINVTNYEILDHFRADRFSGVVLDESSIMKSYTGKTRTEIIEAFERTPYKLSCTATPAPNDYMELGNQCEFLGVMRRTEMLATFFTHDGGETSKWRLKGHAESKFWEWVASWAVVLTNPADLGYDGSEYVLPGLNMVQKVVESSIGELEGQMMLVPKLAQTLGERRESRRDSVDRRVELACEIAKALMRGLEVE